MTKILMTGVSGYIGSNVLKYLSMENSKPDVISRSLLVPTVLNKCGKVYYSDFSELNKLNLSSAYDVFVHIGSANDQDSKEPAQALSWTTFGTRNCLELCKHNKIKNFIYLSTFQVYGKLNKIVNEKRVLKPLNDYAISHKFAEDYIKMYQRTCAINYLILRPSNIFGAPEDRSIDRWSLVPLCFCKELVEKQTITLLSSGKQMYDFINLNDLGKLITFYSFNISRIQNLTLNISSGNRYSIRSMAKLAAERYSLLFKKTGKILVTSHEPKRSIPYKIDRKFLIKTGVKFSNKKSLIQEMDKTFALLTK